ncbi:SpoIID/LytB domain-containing protein [Lutispora sp.]|uniref:SpoIID/LytB domain-containing protein n=1 Tax=Lutispora sp. TaxID=2828727 RepID=UPI0035648B0F
MNKHNKKLFIIILMIIALLFPISVHATTEIPERIRVGLNYNSVSDTININSSSPILITFLSGEENPVSLTISKPIKLSFRTDEYYNIIKNEIKKIQYIKAVKYEGKLLGPYHIQIGDNYPDYESAKKLLNDIKSSMPESFLVYDGEWKVWAGLFLDEKECKENINAYQSKNNSYKYKLIEPDPKRVQIIDDNNNSVFMIYKNQEIKMSPVEQSDVQNLLEFNNTEYRGSICIRTQEDGSLSVINDVKVDEYLYSVVGSEVTPTWHMEALKAQAVAARNYAVINMGKHNDKGFDLCSTTHCQAYKGFVKEHERTNQAVKETNNELLYYEDKLATTFYHSSSGGHTENSENVWSDEIPYIRGVDDPFSYGSPNDSWILELDKGEIKNKLEENNMNIGDITDINIIETSEFGRALKVEFSGTKSKIVLEKEKVRYLFGTSSLKSIWYDIKTDSDINIYDMDTDSIKAKRPIGLNIVSATGQRTVKPSSEKISVKGLFNVENYNITPNNYIFDGKGWGHGLGMSQYGAKGMAESGYNYVEILEYYYTGTKVK